MLMAKFLLLHLKNNSFMMIPQSYACVMDSIDVISRQ